MRFIFGFIVLFVFAVIFSFFQGFIDFLIQLGVFPAQYKNSTNFDIMMIFVLYLLFMATAFAVVIILALFSKIFDYNLTKIIKKSKKKAVKEFGTSLPYFYFINPKYKSGIMFDINLYAYELSKNYLYDTLYEDWDQVENHYSNLSEKQRFDLYYKAQKYYGLPHMPKEYDVLEHLKDVVD